MKKSTFKKIIAIAFCLVFSLSAFGCTVPEKIDSEVEIDVMVLNGTTGFGMAPLMSDYSAEGEKELNLKFSVESAAENVLAALINGSADIAALPTNAASVLYKKTNGNVKVVAINTLGVLYLIENGSSISSFADLEGKTVYVPGQGSNPEYVFNYLCEKNGLEIGKDIFVDFSYSEPAALRTAIASGTVSIAVLPEPMVTIAKNANSSLRTAIDFTAEWEKFEPKDSLVQGCIVARSDFVEEHPNELNKFLELYKSSIEFVISNPEEAGEKIASTGIFNNAAVAKKAIPNCNICYIDGEDMKTSFEVFLNVLYNANPSSIGGALPDDSFYYIAD